MQKSRVSVVIYYINSNVVLEFSEFDSHTTTKYKNMWIRGYDRNWKQYKLDKEAKDLQKKISKLYKLDKLLTKLSKKI